MIIELFLFLSFIFGLGQSNTDWIETEKDRQLYREELQEIIDAYGGPASYLGVAGLGFGRRNHARLQQARAKEREIEKRWRERSARRRKQGHRERKKGENSESSLDSYRRTREPSGWTAPTQEKSAADRKRLRHVSLLVERKTDLTEEQRDFAIQLAERLLEKGDFPMEEVVNAAVEAARDEV